MRKNGSPTGTPTGLLMFLWLFVVLLGLIGVVACGGGNVLPCTFVPPTPNSTTSGAGLGTTIDNPYFSMHLNSTKAPWPSFSFGGQRVWDAGVAWPQVNTSSGVYNWTLMDTWMNQAQSHGVDILYVLARTPAWTSQQPSDSSCRTGPGECDAPLNLDTTGGGSDDAWITWVTAIAQYSKSRKDAGQNGIDYYEIWNEWNATVYWNTKNTTIAQLVRMEQDARCVIEGPPTGLSCNPNSTFPAGTALDPTAKIVTPSEVGGAPMLGAVGQYLQEYFQTTVNGYAGSQFADMIAFHGYVGTGTGTSTTAVQCPTAENVNTVIADMNTTLAANPTLSAGKPLFDTEGGWSKADDEGFTDQDRQVAFLARYLLLQQSAKIARVYWYAWDSKMLSSLYNDVTGKSTLAATAYGELNKWTVGATISLPCKESGTIWTCGFTRTSPAGYTALAVWDANQDCTSTSCPTTSFTNPGAYTMSRDLTGNETALNGSTVQIGAKPILLETAALP